LASRARARADRATPAGPDRGRAGRRAARPRRRRFPLGAAAIIFGFSILCAHHAPPGQIRGAPSTTARARSRSFPMDLLQTLEREESARLGRKEPALSVGDTVIVNVNVVEGSRKRVQAFEGVVIARRNRGLNSSFIVRKISSGEGVERTFQLHSPLIASIEVKRRGDVRRAKLYYLRERSGKSARIKEKLA